MTTIVTGGASGIGRCVAEKLHANGEDVVILDIDADAVTAAATEIGDGVLALMCDVCDEASLMRAAEEVTRRLGKPTGLVCCAGAPQVAGRLEEMELAVFDRVMASHVKGTLLSCRTFARAMDNGKGALVNLASVVGLVPGPTYAYAPAKAAVVNVTSILAVELAARGLRVNAVSPGWVETPFLTRALDNGGQRNTGALAAANPKNSLLSAEQVADVVIFLLSERASGVIGANIVVDNGFSAMRGWAPYAIDG